MIEYVFKIFFTMGIISIYLLIIAFPVTRVIGKAWHRSFLEEITIIKTKEKNNEKKI